MTETDIPATSIYLTPAARRRQFAVSGGLVAGFTALAALSYFSGDPRNTTYYTGEPMNGLAFIPSGAGRGHPAPWLSRQGARRAVALATEPMKVPSSARWYYLFAAVDLYFIYRLARQFRHYLRGAPEIRIDESGLRLFYRARLFWPWSRIKGARATDAQVIVELHKSGGIDQGVRDRTEVSLGTPPLDLPANEIVRLLEAAMGRFGGT